MIQSIYKILTEKQHNVSFHTVMQYYITNFANMKSFNIKHKKVDITLDINTYGKWIVFGFNLRKYHKSYLHIYQGP